MFQQEKCLLPSLQLTNPHASNTNRMVVAMDLCPFWRNYKQGQSKRESVPFDLLLSFAHCPQRASLSFGREELILIKL